MNNWDRPWVMCAFACVFGYAFVGVWVWLLNSIVNDEMIKWCAMLALTLDRNTQRDRVTCMTIRIIQINFTSHLAEQENRFCFFFFSRSRWICVRVSDVCVLDEVTANYLKKKQMKFRAHIIERISRQEVNGRRKNVFAVAVHFN